MMSGRDLRSFVANHRIDQPPEHLVVRVKEGLRSNKYKDIDYEALKAQAAEKKFKGHLSLVKVKKLQQVSKQGKEHNLLKQHKLVWQKEFLRLNSVRKKLQSEIDSLIHQGMNDATCESLFRDLEDYDASLAVDFVDFKKATADPIWNLREDLQYWLMQNQSELKEGGARDSHTQVGNALTDVKQQQKKVMDRLRHEQNVLEQEINTGELYEFAHPIEKPAAQGIPEEAFDLECPDLDLKASVLQEFILLDEEYLQKLDELRDTHADAISSDTGDWSADDHFIFQMVTEQYTYDVHKRWTLILDRLKRHLPNKTRSQVVSHDAWYTSYKYYNSRRRALLTDWQRDRTELLHKAQAVFAEVCLAVHLQQVKQEHQKKQRELCDALYEKVQQWRAQKVEMMEIQHAIEESRRIEQEERTRLQNEKEKKRREEDKLKMQAHYDKINEQRAEVEKRQQERLEELRQILEEQASYDRERVNFRKTLEDEKVEAKRTKEREREEEEAEKERRLEALRETVRPHVEIVPGHAMTETEAWQARRKADEEIHIRRPMFEVNTFTANQITSDPRIRLEQKLRDAGLHNTNYGRQVLSQMAPLHPPRRDMESTVFKN